jgi:predicted ribonuclease YlaK
MKHKNNHRTTRKEKEEGFTRGAKQAKPQWTEAYGYHDFHLTESQQELRDKILNNDLVVCEGFAGVGKSATVLYTFIREYIADKTKQIIVVKTPAEMGTDQIGFLVGGLEDKTAIHFESTKVLMTHLLNAGKIETDLNHRIHFKVPNYLVGHTMDDTLLLIEECQLLQPLILKLILERVGVNSKVVILGDSTQLYTANKDRNALRDIIPRFFKEVGGEMVAKYPYCAYHQFGVEDVQRSEFVKTVIKAYST